MFDIKNNSLELATRKHGCGGNVLGHKYGNNNSHNSPYAQPWTVGYPWPSAQTCSHYQGGCNSTYAPMYAPMYPQNRTQSRTQTYAPSNTLLYAPSYSPTWAPSFSPSLSPSPFYSINSYPPPPFFPPPFFTPLFWDLPFWDDDFPPWDSYDFPPGNWPGGRGSRPGRWNDPFMPGFDPFGPSGWPGDPYSWDPFAWNPRSLWDILKR